MNPGHLPVDGTELTAADVESLIWYTIRRPLSLLVFSAVPA